MEAEQKCPERRLSVDQPEDLEVFRRIVSSMQRPHWTYGWTECLELKDAVRSDRDENENADD
jgi:spore coat polysaccharide biosynthesis protein SpsF (cytidylyltransferase family)